MVVEDATREIKGAIPPSWFTDLGQQDCARLDVRPILEGGVDPLEQILRKVDQLSTEAVLLIEAPFDPIPLRRLMARRGYDSHAVRLTDKHWKVFFKLQERQTLPAFPDLPAFPMTRRDAVLEMDLRELEPPNPMIAVLKLIESGEGGGEFNVWLVRDPIYLYPELVEREWRAVIIEDSEEGLLVKIEKVSKEL